MIVQYIYVTMLSMTSSSASSTLQGLIIVTCTAIKEEILLINNEMPAPE